MSDPAAVPDPDRLPCGWLRLDRHGIVRAANPTLCALVGRPLETIVGRPFDALLTPASRLLHQSYLQPLLQQDGVVSELALGLGAAGGEPVDVLAYAGARAGGEDGRPLLLVPIRERRRIEGELLRVRQAADEAPGMVFQLVETADGRWRFPYVSQAVRTLYRCTEADAARDAEGVLSALAADDRARLLAALREAAATGSACQLRLRTAGAAPRTHELHATPRRLAGGVRGWCGFVADVTEREQLEQAAAERAAAERAARDRGEFLARASHELRTPLNAILGFAQLLGASDDGRLADDQRRQLALMEQAGRRMLALVNQLLDLAQLERGGSTLEPGALALQHELEHAVDGVRPLAAGAGVQVRRHGGDGLVVHADRVALARVLTNLLSNAVKYNRPGGAVDVFATAAGGRVRIEVADTGPGLSAAQQAQLFQPFNRLGARQGPAEGSGLGLVICRQLVEQMGGRLVVDSAPGRGCVFSFELPLEPQRSAAAAEPGADASRAAPAGAFGTVLCVEDDEVNMLLMRMIVGQRMGLRLLAAHSGAEALAAAASQRIDLLLCDLNLPDGDGQQLLHRLRAAGLPAEVPAVLVTAAATPDGEAAARAAGFVERWTKPLSVDGVIRGITRLLARRGFACAGP